MENQKITFLNEPLIRNIRPQIVRSLDFPCKNLLQKLEKLFIPYTHIHSENKYASLSFHPKENILAYSNETTVSLQKINAQRKLTSKEDLLGHKKTIRAVQFNKNDTNQLVSASKDNIFLWDVNQQKKLSSLNSKSYVLALDINAQELFVSYNNSTINYNESIIKCIDLRNNKSSFFLNTEYSSHSISYSPDNFHITNFGKDRKFNGAIEIWDTRQLKIIHTKHFPLDNFVGINNKITYTKDGLALYFATGIKLYKMNTKNFATQCLIDKGPVPHCEAHCLNPDEEYIALGIQNRLTLFDLQTKNLIQIFKGASPVFHITNCCFNYNNELVACSLRHNIGNEGQLIYLDVKQLYRLAQYIKNKIKAASPVGGNNKYLTQTFLLAQIEHSMNQNKKYTIINPRMIDAFGRLPKSLQKLLENSVNK